MFKLGEPVKLIGRSTEGFENGSIYLVAKVDGDIVYIQNHNTRRYGYRHCDLAKLNQDLLRDKVAAMAMQGVLSGNISQLLGDDITSDRIAFFAIECADELIKALNEKP